MCLGRQPAALLGMVLLATLGATAAQAADLPWGPYPAPVPYGAPDAVGPGAAPLGFRYGFDPLPEPDPCVRKPQPVMDPSGLVIGYRVLRLCN